MRIISGLYKGKRISAPSTITARPTTDFAKEGLFNVLNNIIDFDDIDVLDLFSGTGSISFEFISRNCRHLISVEQNERHCAFIRKVSTDLKITNLQLVKTDVFRFVKSCSLNFDVIFADPPYELTQIEEIPDLIFKKNILKPDGLFILEHSAKNDFSNHPNFENKRHYGNVNFSFFRQK